MRQTAHNGGKLKMPCLIPRPFPCTNQSLRLLEEGQQMLPFAFMTIIEVIDALPLWEGKEIEPKILHQYHVDVYSCW